MIVLKQDIQNQIVVTLTEKKTVITDVYLLELTNQTSFVSYYLVIEDVSSRKERFNLFALTLGTDLILPLNGFYLYNIYENPDELLLPTGLNKVETGKLFVSGETETTTAYQNETPDLIVYNPNSPEIETFYFMAGGNDTLIDSNGENLITQ
jgi:hypothetical protein